MSNTSRQAEAGFRLQRENGALKEVSLVSFVLFNIKEDAVAALRLVTHWTTTDPSNSGFQETEPSVHHAVFCSQYTDCNGCGGGVADVGFTYAQRQGNVPSHCNHGFMTDSLNIARPPEPVSL